MQSKINNLEKAIEDQGVHHGEILRNTIESKDKVI